MTLTKAVLTKMLAERIGLNGREAEDMVAAFFEELSAALERGECVRLSGFGNFQLRRKAPRPGRNPKTGEPAVVSPRTVVTFHAGRKLRVLIERGRRVRSPTRDA